MLNKCTLNYCLTEFTTFLTPKRIVSLAILLAESPAEMNVWPLFRVLLQMRRAGRGWIKSQRDCPCSLQWRH